MFHRTNVFFSNFTIKKSAIEKSYSEVKKISDSIYVCDGYLKLSVINCSFQALLKISSAYLNKKIPNIPDLKVDGADEKWYFLFIEFYYKACQVDSTRLFDKRRYCVLLILESFLSSPSNRQFQEYVECLANCFGRKRKACQGTSSSSRSFSAANCWRCERIKDAQTSGF